MKAEDKALIMQTLTTLTNSITKLQEEIKGLSSANALRTTLKSKAQVHTLTRHDNQDMNLPVHVYPDGSLIAGSEGAPGHRVGPL